jgi:hypothetical protein
MVYLSQELSFPAVIQRILLELLPWVAIYLRALAISL